MAGLLRPAQRGGAGQPRLAGGFGFERPGIRGLAKMRLRVTMALTIMLALALGASGPANVSTCGVWSDPPERRPLAAHHDNPIPLAAQRNRSALSCPPSHR